MKKSRGSTGVKRSAAGQEYEKLYQLFEHAPVLFAVFRGPDCVCEFANVKTRSMWGDTSVIGKPIKAIMQSIGEVKYHGFLEKVYQKDEPIDLKEFPFTADWNHTGTVVDEYFDLSITPYHENGTIDGVVLIGSRVTQEVEARKLAEISETNFRSLMENAPDAIIIYGATDNKFYDVNPAATHMVGYSKAEMLRMKVTDFLRPTEKTRLQMVKEERKHGSTRLVEWQAKHKDGSFVDIEANTIFLDDRQVFVSFIRDISYRKKMEAEIQKASVKERVLKTKTKLLQEQQKKLLSINKAKDEFIMVASHQLRTPATIVKQYLGMLLQNYAGELSDTQRKMLETSYASNERQVRIVNDLLLIAKIDAGEIMAAADKQDVVKSITQLTESLRPIFDAKKQPLTVSAPNSLQWQYDDPYLTIALENIIKNASHYSYESSPVTIEVTNTTEALEITVTDKGVGIAKDDHKLLFQKFTRIPNPLSDFVDGNGLGLYISKEIVSMHGGSISVTSRKGKGSSFTVTIPHKQ